MKLVFEMDGDHWCCHFDNFINLQESPAGFAKHIFGALCNLWNEYQNDQSQFTDTQINLMRLAMGL